MNYGFSYKGSKNKLAEKIVKLFPDADNFYDLFCGGCAITHRALIENRWKNFIANDVDSRCTDLFLDAVHGKFKNETRWISREDFYNLRDKDGYIAFLWSFGNNGRDYLYAKDLEPYKKAWHYALFFDEYSDAKKFLNINFEEIQKEKHLYKKYLLSKTYVKQNPRLQSLEGLQRLQRLQRLQKPKTFCKSYNDIVIQNNSIVYCDIPYLNTNSYGNKNKNNFDYKEFYDWCKNQKELVFISSYQMPEEFISIAEIPHRCILSSRNNKAVTEKVFIPKHQLDLYKQKMTS